MQASGNDSHLLPAHEAGNGSSRRPCAIFILDLNEVARQNGMPVCQLSDFAVDLDTQVCIVARSPAALTT